MVNIVIQLTDNILSYWNWLSENNSQSSMKKIYTLLTGLSLLSAPVAFSQETNVVPGNLLVMVGSDAQARQLTKELGSINGSSTGLKVERTLSESMHIYLMSFDPTAVNSNLFLNAIKQNHLVKIAQFNHTFQERIIPNDVQFVNMWDMHNTGASGGVADADIDAPEAWDITTGGLTAAGDSIVVAVIDGGFDLAQPDLNFWKNYQEIPGNGIDDDLNGYVDDRDGWNGATATDNFSVASHGTHVSGTVGARGNNTIGVTGVNWNVKVMPISYGTGGSFEANVVASYAFAMDQRRIYNQTNGAKGAFVVSTNSSFGIDLAFPASYPLWCAMFDSLGSVGIISAGATANANYNIDTQGDIPTSCLSNWLIAVTNTTRTDAKNSSCGYGATMIDLGAPGTSITSTYPSSAYSSISGTSMATPHVAGTVALMCSVNCLQFITDYKADPAGIALMLKDSLLGAVDVIPSMSSGITLTGGRLNLYKSVRSVQNYCTAVDVGDLEGQTGFEIQNVYPNPATNQLNVVYNSFDAVEISVSNVLGQEVKRVKGDTSTKGIQHSKIDISGLNKGVYFVSINTSDKKSNVVKVIVY